MKFCQSCGQQNAEDARFCEKCGTALEQSVPVAQVPKASEPSVASAQLKQAVGKVSSIGRVPLIGVGVLAVVLLAAFIAFRPMSSDVYEDRADEYSADLMDASEQAFDALNEYRSWNDSFDGTDKVDEDDWKETRKEVEESLADMKKAGGKIRGLRPPAEYKSADRRLNSWAAFYLEDVTKEFDDVLAEVEPGDKYSKVDSKIERMQGSLERGFEKSYRDLSRAGEDLDLALVTAE